MTKINQSELVETLKQKFSEHVRNLQIKISSEMQAIDSQLLMLEDQWQRQDHLGQAGGGGFTRAFNGSVFENAGVNYSKIFGAIDPKFAGQLKGSGDSLWACGISLILHPHNPKIPTVHANFRMIEQGGTVWFGGGADLTPFYPIEEDFHSFHHVWKKACAPFGCYQEMKEECDRYFVNHHREGEMRGIGGIFFDHYNSGDLERDFSMVVDLSNHFIESYFPIVRKRLSETYTEADVDFQLHRRGRYVEFNLVHDRGTLFGLKTNGRIDSILISLPARCKFTYAYKPQSGSAHEKMMRYYRPFAW
jgi:coproporphyrinogen III oxidase